MSDERLFVVLVAAMAGLGLTIAAVAVLAGYPAVARGAVAGASLALVYLSVLRRFVRAFVMRARGEQVGLLNRLVLQSGMPGRLLLAAAGLILLARNHPWVNLWSAIITFLSYRVVVGVYEIVVILVGRQEPVPPGIGWSEESVFLTRERLNIGRRRRWRQGR
ncbi:MAG: hypothetical protein HY692_03865 [Cyanobacteria bacterium NC_groundwater_1444_Ag_S-0.65um_54_12]|nr:hypothetical protein [Cyanobacteria bacterium NC_groundwater_1444_Ag_S-0.65um_54_12]